VRTIRTAKLLFACIGSLIFIGAGVLPTAAAGSGETVGNKRPEISASIWAVPEEGAMVTLLVFGRPKPVFTPLTAQTQIDGVCVHCQIPLTFKAGDAVQRCRECPCGYSNMACLTGMTSRGGDWKAMFRALPRGARLRAEYADTDKPESGLKRLSVDRHAALLPVEGLAGLSSDQLLALTRPLGAIRVELSEDGRQLHLTLKGDWTTDREKRLERALASKDAKIAYPVEEKAKP
jgi:hypothetical protein